MFVSNLTFLNFQFKNNFEFLDQICPRNTFMIKNKKSEHHYWIPHIQISLGTKFQLKLTILIFFYQICPKRAFLVKNGKIALVRASMVVTYYTKLFRTGADRCIGILMSLLLLVAEKITRMSRAPFEIIITRMSKSWYKTFYSKQKIQKPQKDEKLVSQKNG